MQTPEETERMNDLAGSVRGLVRDQIDGGLNGGLVCTALASVVCQVLIDSNRPLDERLEFADWLAGKIRSYVITNGAWQM